MFVNIVTRHLLQFSKLSVTMLKCMKIKKHFECEFCFQKCSRIKKFYLTHLLQFSNWCIAMLKTKCIKVKTIWVWILCMKIQSKDEVKCHIAKVHEGKKVLNVMFVNCDKTFATIFKIKCHESWCWSAQFTFKKHFECEFCFQEFSKKFNKLAENSQKFQKLGGNFEN